MEKEQNPSKSSKKSSKKYLVVENQEDNKIISEEEMKQKMGITGNKTLYFKAFLRSYLTEDVHHIYDYNLTGLAKYIYSMKIFYIHTKNGYRLMKFSSIIDNINQLSKQVLQEMKEEAEMKLRYKSRK